MDIVWRVADEFSVKFDGAAFDAHTMDVRMLAPSLLALGDAFQAAHAALSQDGAGDGTPAPTLQIQATNEGSFDIDLIVGMFGNDPLSRTVNIATVSGVNLYVLVQGAIRLMGFLRGRKLQELERPTVVAHGEIVYRSPDGHVLTFPLGAEVLVNDGKFRAAISGFTEPLDAEGVESVSIRSNAEPEAPVVIPASERSSYEYQPEETLLDRSTRQTKVKALTVQLDPDNARKWRFSEGGETITARVMDQKFLLSIQSRLISIGAADLLEVEIEESTFRRAAGGVRIERVIVRVLGIVPGPVQDEFQYEF